MTHRRKSTSGRESVMRVRPAESSHTLRHPGVSTSCATSQSSVGSQPLFLKEYWKKQRLQRDGERERGEKRQRELESEREREGETEREKRASGNSPIQSSKRLP